MSEIKNEITVSEAENSTSKGSGKSELEQLRADVELYKNQAADFESKYMYACAEIQNTRKRYSDMASKSFVNGKIEAINHIFRVVNDLNLAVNASNDSGIKLVYDNLVKGLAQTGVEIIMPEVGTMFDENTMECISVVAVAEIDNNAVWVVAEPGYKMNGVTVRCAKVIVNKPE